MTGKSRFILIELLVFGTAAVMAVGLIAILVAITFNGPRIERLPSALNSTLSATVETIPPALSQCVSYPCS